MKPRSRNRSAQRVERCREIGANQSKLKRLPSAWSALRGLQVPRHLVVSLQLALWQAKRKITQLTEALEGHRMRDYLLERTHALTDAVGRNCMSAACLRDCIEADDVAILHSKQKHASTVQLSFRLRHLGGMPTHSCRHVDTLRGKQRRLSGLTNGISFAVM